MNRYKISVTMAVYNVQDYIDEAMQSIIKQTMGFEHIQVIMVDDCSSDDSASVCKKYSELYPDNVVFIQKKENSGAADTRNVAIEYIQGELTTSIDPDDYVDLDMFERVYDYYNEVKNEVDMVSVALRFFEAESGYHPCSQNRFWKTRVIDVEKEWYSIQLNTCGAFVKSEVFMKYRYPQNLIVDSEDTYIINKVILEKKKYAVLAKCDYHYRKRTVKNSLTQTSAGKKEWYSAKMRNFQLDLVNQSLEMYGEVLRYIQFLCMYVTQWNVRNNYGKAKVLDEKETEEYIGLLNQMLQYIDDDIIVNQSGNKQLDFNVHMVNFWLKVKYGRDVCQYIFKNSNMYKTIGTSMIYALAEHGLNISTLEICDNTLRVSGYYTYPFEESGLVFKIYVNEVEMEFESYQSETFMPKYFGICASDCYEFFCKINLNDKENKNIMFVLQKGIFKYYFPMIFNHSPYNKLYPKNAKSYYVKDGYEVCVKGKTLSIRKTNKKSHFKKEMQLYKYLLSGKPLLRKKSSNVKAVLLRIIYWLSYPVYHGCWLFMDRADKGGDNADFLFRYSVKQQDGIKKYFIVNQKSVTYKKMRREGLPVVKQLSLKHRLLFLHSAKFITSQMDVIYMNDMRGIEIFFRDLFAFDYIHIQHGISWQNLDHLLNANLENLKLMTSCSNEEYKNLKQQKYGYVDGQLRKCGMARFDGFANKEKEKKQILVCPTWRRELVGRLAVDGTRAYSDKFKESIFFEVYNNLLSDEEFINRVEASGYTILFALHPNMQSQRKDFTIDARVEFPDRMEIDYDMYLRESQIMITDYSGIQFDFAYMKKPIIYLHHRDLPNHLEVSEYFNYERDAFGDICDEVEQLKEMVYEVIQNEGVMKPEYIKRVDKFFIYNDFNNCQRIYEEIVKSVNLDIMSG